MKKITVYLTTIVLSVALIVSLSGCEVLDEFMNNTTEKEDQNANNIGDLNNTYTESVGLEYKKIGNVAYEVVGMGTCKDSHLVIPDTYNGLPVVSIGYEAFRFNHDLTSVIVGKNVETIGKFAFDSCENITNVVLPHGLKCIDEFAFECCSNLQAIVIPDSVTVVDRYAFSMCYSMKSVKLPNGLMEVSYYCFGGCAALENVVIPDGVELISIGAFAHCEELKSVTIPSSVKTIYGAFSSEYKLETVYYKGSETEWQNIYIESSALLSVNIIYNCE